MRLAGAVLEGISALILAYSPKHKQLLVKSPEQENMFWLIDINCGEALIRKGPKFMQLFFDGICVLKSGGEYCGSGLR